MPDYLNRNSGLQGKNGLWVGGRQNPIKLFDQYGNYLQAGYRNTWWVDQEDGANANSGRSLSGAFATITKAISSAAAGDLINVLPGRYDESPTIARAKSNLTINAVGGRGSAYIDPSTEDADGLICHADDVSIINLGIAAEDTTAGNYALQVSGSRFRAYGCKIEGGEQQVRIGPGTVAQEAAGTHGVGADALFRDCEICWGTDGFILVCTDYGAVTQVRLEDCRFHNLTGKHITEVVGSGGAAGVMFRNFEVERCSFGRAEGGTEPTNYIDLNGDNANDGYAADCTFPTAINGGKNLVSTAFLWVANKHTGGISTGQPS